MATPNHDIDIGTMLFLRYKNPVVPLLTVIDDYMPYMKIATANKKARACQLPFPAFQTGGGAYFVNVADVARWLESARTEASKDWQNMQS
ncbi:pyocin activator PrtN family protein [Moraxella sp. Pampa]|uniref:pyocin activator PrtN family protein n=1 Tax=Moraxella sp. Pampa TaxID=3111978 RepID=UPI002B407BC0|nr:pyocin activator PrtN family protein [Moraxella sp. Pampa]